MTRATVLGPFYQTNPELGAPSVDVIAHSRIGAIRALHIDDMPGNPMPDKEIHARLYTVGDEAEMQSMWRGSAGADEYFAMCRPRYDKLKALGIYHVSGGNEPHPITREQMVAANAWQVRLAELVGNYGMCYWCWDWGVGWPDHGLAHLWVNSVRVARQTGGGLCTHLYGAPDVFENQHYPDEHYALRVVRQIRELYDAGLMPGERWIIVGECGIDGGLIEWGQEPFTGRRRRGWRDWSDWVYQTPQGHRSMDERLYWERLSAYDDTLRAIPEIRWAFPFIAHPLPDWRDFTVTQHMLDQMAAKANATAVPGPTNAELGDWMQQFVVPLNPDAALVLAARAMNAGALAVSPERDYGNERVQVFRFPGEAKQHLFAATVGAWDKVRHWERQD